MIMTAANYLDDETLLNHLPCLTPEEESEEEEEKVDG